MTGSPLQISHRGPAFSDEAVACLYVSSFDGFVGFDFGGIRRFVVCIEGLLLDAGYDQGMPEASAAIAKSAFLAYPLPEVIEPCASRVAMPLDFDLGDLGAVQRQDSLDTLVGDDASDGDRFGQAGALDFDNDAAEDLDALLAALDNADVHIDGVAHAHVWQIGLELRFLDVFDG